MIFRSRRRDYLGLNQAPTLNLSSAQIKTLASSPVSWIPAPGANRILVPMLVELFYTFVTTGYSTGNYIIVSPNDATIISGYGVAWMNENGFLDATADAYANMYPFTAFGSGFPITNWANQALYVTTQSGVDPNTGDGTLRMEMLYRIVDV